MKRERRTFYRDKFNGKLMGVCAGLGDYFNLDPLWFRLGFIILFIIGNALIFVLYFAIVLLTKKKPPHMYTDSLSRTFAEPYVAPPAGDLISPASRKRIDHE